MSYFQSEQTHLGSEKVENLIFAECIITYYRK